MESLSLASEFGTSESKNRDDSGIMSLVLFNE